MNYLKTMISKRVDLRDKNMNRERVCQDYENMIEKASCQEL